MLISHLLFFLNFRKIKINEICNPTVLLHNFTEFMFHVIYTPLTQMYGNKKWTCSFGCERTVVLCIVNFAWFVVQIWLYHLQYRITKSLSNCYILLYPITCERCPMANLIDWNIILFQRIFLTCHLVYFRLYERYCIHIRS